MVRSLADRTFQLRRVPSDRQRNRGAGLRGELLLPEEARGVACPGAAQLQVPARRVRHRPEAPGALRDAHEVVAGGRGAVRAQREEHLRRQMETELNFPPNFEGLVLGCIEADFCK